ncbi:MAG: 23S rRNA (uracil(1939)-C(5))-methyltransferase RlmD [Vulcanimicrobiota bacterium]
MNEFTPGEIYPLELTSIAMGGEALGRLEDMAVFVPNGVPGDKIEVRLTDVKKNYARGEINRIIKPSPHRVEPPCPIFYQCGGCQLQQMTYEAQLVYKKKMAYDTIRHLGAIQNCRIQEIVEAPSPWYYRNKMQAVAASKLYLHSKKQSPYFGLYARKTHKVIKMEKCMIQHPLTNQALNVVKEAMTKLQWPVYDEKGHTGLVRYLVSRVSSSRNELLLMLVTTTDRAPNISEFINIVTTKMPTIKGIVINVNPKKGNVILGPTCKAVWGESALIEEIKRTKFQISPLSFFQVNPIQTGNLLEKVEEILQPGEKDIILDAYCGIGAISIYLAKKVRKVIGIEEVPHAKKDALASAQLNDVKNFEFIQGQVEKELPRLYHQGQKIDKVVIDPPRKGCDPRVLDMLANMRVKTIAYVSCNPATLARDVKILTEKGYSFEELVPLDMFPQTYHVESVAKLTYGPKHKASLGQKQEEIRPKETLPKGKPPCPHCQMTSLAGDDVSDYYEEGELDFAQLTDPVNNNENEERK